MPSLPLVIAGWPFHVLEPNYRNETDTWVRHEALVGQRILSSGMLRMDGLFKTCGGVLNSLCILLLFIALELLYDCFCL